MDKCLEDEKRPTNYHWISIKKSEERYKPENLRHMFETAQKNANKNANKNSNKNTKKTAK